MGLTSYEVENAIKQGNINSFPDKSSKSSKEIIRENVFTYFNLIFLILSVLLISAKAYRSLTILFVVIFNTLIGIVQQLKAKKTLDELQVISKFKVKTYRDNNVVEVPADELVLNDEVIFSSGDQICADAVVIGGRVSVNESLLTGESDEVEKNVGDTLLSGSFVVNGNCNARLTHVGNDSYVSKITSEAKAIRKNEQSDMVQSINRFVLFAGIAIIPIGITLFIQGLINEVSYQDNVTAMVAAVVGMIPEGLYLLVSVTLAVGAGKLAIKKVMLHDMKSIETLARVDTLCIDKTGTITENTMSVKDVIFEQSMTEKDKNEAKELLGAYLTVLSDKNPTTIALRDYFDCSGHIAPRNVENFSSSRKYSSVTLDEYELRLGAPEIVLGDLFTENRSVIEEHAAQGERVIAFARIDKEDDAQKISLLMLISLYNPIRENVTSTLDFFKRQQVKIKVISGDGASTVSAIAKKAGISDSGAVIDARKLIDSKDIESAVNRYDLFARVTPEQKKKIILELKKQGHTVAMTGDGVNDIMAMKVADCSVALASGVDAAIQSAQVVLMDSDFSHMPEIVSEGRRIIGNIERSATLFLCKNIFSLLLALFSIVNLMAYPIQPEQISLISMFNIGIPAFLLAIEPNEHRIKEHFMSRVLLRAMPAALTDFILIAAMMIFGVVFKISEDDISVSATLLLAVVGFIILRNISRPVTRYRVIVIAGCITGFVVTIILGHSLYSITKISLECSLLLILFVIAAEPFMRYLTRLFEAAEKALQKRKL